MSAQDLHYSPWGRPGSGAPTSDIRKKKFLEIQLTSPKEEIQLKTIIKDFSEQSAKYERSRASYPTNSVERPRRFENTDHVKQLLRTPDSDTWTGFERTSQELGRTPSPQNPTMNMNALFFKTPRL